jgi:hypothetical protein
MRRAARRVVSLFGSPAMAAASGGHHGFVIIAVGRNKLKK